MIQHIFALNSVNLHVILLENERENRKESGGDNRKYSRCEVGDVLVKCLFV